MSRDHYAVLGVSRTSEDVVIRAAYRALMRRYHPDADPSSDAAERAQAINAAYAVLSDPDKRARYDGSLAAQGLIKPEAPHRVSLTRRIVPGPAGMIGLAALAVAATAIILSPPIGVLPEDGLPLAADPPPGGAVQPMPVPEQSVRRDLDDADAVKPSTAAPATEQVPNAMLEPAEELVAPAPREVRTAQSEFPRPKPAIEQVAKKAPTETRARKPAAVASDARSDCRLGTGWADRAICNSANLTGLDRQNGLLYAQSWSKADDAKRAALVGSRDRFLAKRNACRSENCLTSTYIARLREISDIMARGSQQ